MVGGTKGWMRSSVFPQSSLKTLLSIDDANAKLQPEAAPSNGDEQIMPR